MNASEIRDALDAFRRIVQALRLGAKDGERRAGLSGAQLFALQQIGEHPHASVTDLAALTFTHQSSVSVVVQRLVARRLVARVTSPEDRRRQRLTLTAKGRRAIERAPAPVQERLIEAIAALRPAERRALAASLTHVARALSPEAAARPAPMLFEEAAPGRSPRRRRTETQRAKSR